MPIFDRASADSSKQNRLHYKTCVGKGPILAASILIYAYAASAAYAGGDSIGHGATDGETPITVSGCAVSGLEGCLVLRTREGESYNITGAKPSPTLSTFGEIKGTLKPKAATFCLPGKVINPATWTQKSGNCPFPLDEKK
jgi:hypothetical protein